MIPPNARVVNLPDLEQESISLSDDGSHRIAFMKEWPEWKYIGSVWWDEDGKHSTDVWWNKFTRTQWYYQDRDNGVEPSVVQTSWEGLLRHLRDQRLGSCDSAIRGLTLEIKIRRYYG